MHPKEKPVRGSFDAAGALLLGIGTTGMLLFLTTLSWIALDAGTAGPALVCAYDPHRLRSVRLPAGQPDPAETFLRRAGGDPLDPERLPGGFHHSRGPLNGGE
ncbi:hypothetical protein [Paenibacillus sp. DMB5]|uniref:hypothetical protein n=1 Tax=Paenibacillus sp. DMB5 TaxID=1780103 RepID=UPI00076CFDFA|nr:hypothetical protein [Paenibacillus sp. DMB5]KUP22244.1 hypothetical protein AWJ19_07105 [Paenibacillus sp. DMB5]